MYYFFNLSLSELAGIYNISRNACYKQIQIAIEKLKDYEEKLGLYQKNKKIEELISIEKDENIKKVLESLI